MLLRALIHHGADTHAAIAAACDCNVALLGVLVLMEPAAGAQDVVKHVLLVEQAACVVPLVTILTAPACIHKGEHAAVRSDPRHHGRRKRSWVSHTTYE